jgi:DNA primase
MDLRDEIKNRVREAADIVQVIGECVELKKTGARYTGLCPFHAEKTPSFSVNPQGQFFHCFGCGESGDVFSFMMKYHHLSFPDALKDLARRYQIDLPERKMSDRDRARMRMREQLYRVNHEAADIFHNYLKKEPEAAPARDYLRRRGVPEEMIDRYRLGYTPAPETAGWKFITARLQARKFSAIEIEQAGLAVKKDSGGYYDRFRDRVLFPIYDMSGREVAFGGRILGDGKPKYMNSPESPVFDKSRLLFGLFQHREAIRKSRRAIVVEGNFDLLLLAVYGVNNVVAPLGTALTRSHIKALRGYCDEVVLLFDGDSAGLKAARRSIPFFLAEQVEGKVALLPEGHDPDSLVREKEHQGIQALVEAAQPLAEFVFSSLESEYGLTLSGKNRIMQELSQLIAQASDPAQRDLMTAHFSEKLGVSPARFHSGVSLRPAPGTDSAQNMERMSLARLDRKQRQLVDFLVLYPEYLGELLQGGLEELECDPAVTTVIDCLQQMEEEGAIMPERLLAVLPENSDRLYIADVLMRGPGENVDPDQHGRELCNELLAWLQSVRSQQERAILQQEIREAQQAGDTELLMQLLQKMQEVAKKKSVFADNLLKEE